MSEAELKRDAIAAAQLRAEMSERVAELKRHALAELKRDALAAQLRAECDPTARVEAAADRVAVHVPVSRAPGAQSGIPNDAAARKAAPVYSGVVAYFPDALVAVAEVSRIGNDQHNPGEPLHWAKEKSRDETDALMRHLVDRAAGTEFDTDGVRHLAKAAWRALAALQREIDAARERGGPARERK